MKWVSFVLELAGFAAVDVAAWMLADWAGFAVLGVVLVAIAHDLEP